MFGFVFYGDMLILKLFPFFFLSALGPRYPEKGKSSYGNAPFAGPPREPTRLPGQGWRFPPRSASHRHSFIPPYDGPIPVTSRGV